MRLLKTQADSFRWALQTRVCHKRKVSGRPAPSRAVGAIFPAASARSVPLGHFLVTLAGSQTLHHQKDYDSLKAQMTVSAFKQ